MNPPKKILRFLRWFCREDYIDEIEGDLIELYRKEAQQAPRWSKWLFAWRVIKYLRPEFIKSFNPNSHRDSFQNALHMIMIRNHIKTSLRNVARNKLFSTINIVGLAIGMSVGLLLIAFVHDLVSYDRFNEKGNRIYRIASEAKFRIGHNEKFASTSVKIRNLIRD